jgi:hypothetical protein
LEKEKTVVAKKHQDIKMENAQMARDISRNKMFNKKDEQRKEKKENQNKQRGIIKDLNKDIEE